MNETKLKICFSSEEAKEALESIGSYSIPFEEVKKLIDILKWGSGYRIAIELLVLTGMRISELDRIKTNCFYGNYIVWKPGKNQTGYRKEKLPDWFLEELDYFFKNNNLINQKVFSFNSNSLNRFVNQDIRPILKGMWLIKRIRSRGSLKGLEYVYQLKSLRHNYATLEFAKNMSKYGVEASVHLTSRKMKHSSTHMTASHYLENFDSLNIERYKLFDMEEIIKQKTQTKITEYLK